MTTSEFVYVMVSTNVSPDATEYPDTRQLSV